MVALEPCWDMGFATKTTLHQFERQRNLCSVMLLDPNESWVDQHGAGEVRSVCIEVGFYNRFLNLNGGCFIVSVA